MRTAKLRASKLFRWEAILLLAVFVFASTPHDFIHQFTGHQDTRDVYLGHTAVSVVHIHCEFLRILLSPTVPSAEAALDMPSAKQLVLKPEIRQEAPYHALIYRQHRGPPGDCGFISYI